MQNIHFHLIDLKYKLVYIFISIAVSFVLIYKNCLLFLFILINPIGFFIKNQSFDFVFTHISDILNVSLLVSINLCFFFNLPLILLFFYFFAKSGLFLFESVFLNKCLLLFVFNLVFCVIFVYSFLFPFIISFLLDFTFIKNNLFLLVNVMPNLKEYINAFFNFIFFYSFTFFQLPLYVYMYLFLFDTSKYFFFKIRRVFIFFAFLFVCLILPPDFFMLTLLSLGCIFFMEFLILFTLLKYRYSKMFLTFYNSTND